MANPQWEEGFVKIATEIWESLCKTRIPGQVRQVVDVIIRKTWGFNKKWDWISLDQFSDLTGMCKPHVSRALRQAQSMNLITKKGNAITNVGNKDGVSYCFVKDYETWRPLPKKVALPKKVISVTKKGNRPLPILGTTIDTLTKDTSTKDTLSPKKSGDHKEAVDYWCSKYEQPPPGGFGMKYNFRGGKDGMAVKRLLATFGLEVFCQLVDRLFASDDPFYRTGGGRTLTVLSANANKLAQELARKDSFLEQLSEAGRATYLAGQEVLRARKQRRKDTPDTDSVQ